MCIKADPSVAYPSDGQKDILSVSCAATDEYAVTRETAGRQIQLDRTELFRTNRGGESFLSNRELLYFKAAVFAGLLYLIWDIAAAGEKKGSWKDSYVLRFMHDLDGKKRIYQLMTGN